ncbi:MAG: MotA/TolQ/ExbB proton channel family protein [Methylococcales bacterium]
MNIKIRPFNYSTLLGIAFSAVLLGFIILYAATDPLAFINVPGLFIVIFGTLAALCFSYPLRDIKQSLKSIHLIIFYESLDPRREAEEITRVAQLWSNRDLLGVENIIDSINNPYLKIGFQLIIDNTPMDDMLSLLKWRIVRLRAKEQVASNIFHSMANYAPAFGMLGTLIGLVNMLEILAQKDISAIGFNMGVALITTFYGLMFANLIFNPIAIKLERRTEQRVMIMSMVMAGISLIAERRSPSYIRETLYSFIVHHEDELQR